MHLNALDWTIIIVFVGIIMGIAAYTRRYARGVADFLSANRCAGRYLLCISQGMAVMGAASIISEFQHYYITGFSGAWWNGIFIGPLLTVLMISGWVVYRYRETRVLTMAQFFEIRYSHRFRIFSGLIAFVAGLINYGVYPAIGASFFMYLCGLPEYVGIFPTFHLLMFILLALSVYSTFSGGQIAVIATDFVQGMFLNFVFLAIFLVVLWKFGLTNIFDGLLHAPPGQSMVNPIDIQGNQGYNLWFYVILAFTTLYGYRVWQGQQGYNSSARTAHEAKMANILGGLRWLAFLGAIQLVPLCAYMLLHHPDYSHFAAEIGAVLDGITNSEVRSQMTTPVAMTQFVPRGLMGCFAAAVFAAFITTHNTQLHSWASIFIQDVVMPLRKTSLSSKAHLRWLRIAVVGVAAFVFVFSCIFRQSQHFMIYSMLSSAVFIAGAGICLVGGLYWKKGTTAGSWGAMITGAVICMTAILLEQYWVYAYDKSFPIDFKWWAAIAMFSSGGVYLLFALLSNEAFNMDKMLHRGKYGIEGEHVAREPRRHMRWLKVLGLSDEFSRFDKFIWWFTLLNGWLNSIYSLVVTIVHFKIGFSDEMWKTVHLIRFWWNLIIFVPAAVFLTVGGFRDLFQFFRDLKQAKASDADDGRVVGHVSAADVELVEKVEHD